MGFRGELMQILRFAQNDTELWTVNCRLSAALYSGTGVPLRMSSTIARAWSDFLSVEIYRELTTQRCQKTGIIRRLKSSGMQ